MMETLQGLKRTHMCANLGLDNVNQEVVLMGWTQRRRDLGGVIFVDLRDRSGIVQVVFNAESSQEIFEKAEHQERALIELYRMVIPDWDRLERLEGFPVVGQEMWKYICQLFIDLDQRLHPEIFNGGLWINAGFSCSGDLGPWEISMDRCRFIYS